MTVVLDASATVEYLIGSSRAPDVRNVIRALGESLHVPALCDVEVASAFRRLLLRGDLTQDRTVEALRDYLDLPLHRYGHQNLLARVLALRTHFSACDATYVALAERLQARLVTGDEALARAIGRHLEVEALLV